MFYKKRKSAVDSLRLAHGSLHMETLDVLPSFFQEGDQKVDSHIQVSSNFIFGHVDGGNGSSQTKDFLQLESNIKNYT